MLVGWNRTLTAQVPPGGNAAVQVFALTAKPGGSPGIGLFVSVIEAAGTPLAAPPVLVTVKACGSLCCPC